MCNANRIWTGGQQRRETPSYPPAGEVKVEGPLWVVCIARTCGAIIRVVLLPRALLARRPHLAERRRGSKGFLGFLSRRAAPPW